MAVIAKVDQPRRAIDAAAGRATRRRRAGSRSDHEQPDRRSAFAIIGAWAVAGYALLLGARRSRAVRPWSSAARGLEAGHMEHGTRRVQPVA